MVSIERKVGIFFLVGLVLLLFLSILVGKIRPFQKGFYLYITFDYVAGLRVGDEVRLAGLKVGEVRNLEFSGNRILVTIWVRKGTPIKKDSRFTIRNVSIMGGKLVSISLGSPEAEFIKPGSVVRGVNPPRVEELVDVAMEWGERIRNTVDKLSQLVDNLNSWLDENRDKLTQSVEKFEGLLASAKNIAQEIEEGRGTLGLLIHDPTMYREGKKALESFSRAGKRVEDISEKMSKELLPALEDLKNILKKIRKGEGTLGKLVSSEEFYEEVSKTLKSTRTLTQETGELVKKLKRVRTYWGYEGGYSPSEKGMRHLGYLRIEPREGKYYLVGGGMDLIREEPFFRAEMGKEIRKGIYLKGGWLDWGGGVGVDVALKNKLSFQLEGAYKEGVRPFYLRGNLYFPLTRNIKVFLGGENLLDDSFLTIGIRVEFEDEDIKYLVGALSAAR